MNPELVEAVLIPIMGMGDCSPDELLDALIDPNDDDQVRTFAREFIKPLYDHWNPEGRTRVQDAFAYALTQDQIRDVLR